MFEIRYLQNKMFRLGNDFQTRSRTGKEYTGKNMIYIITAIYAEAHAFITRFQLKKEISHTHFQVFLNREADICLAITGTGPIPAAAAVSSICTEYGAGPGDFLLNVGVCAQIQNNESRASRAILMLNNESLFPQAALMSNENESRAENICQNGKLFLCSKIREQFTGRIFYPDILYRHKFAEAQIVTGAGPYKKTEQTEIEEADFYLYDMEAAAVYQAGSYYLGPHQMSFLKIVSDNGNTGNVTPLQIERLIDRNMEDMADYITDLQMAARQERQDKIFQEITAQEELEKLCRDMHCSRVMSESVRQYIRYCILSGVDYVSVMEEMYRKGKLPCKDKREGKQCFEELKERLL